MKTSLESRETKNNKKV